ncbi:helix-turn-helix transcriptional regulator [Bittarella massiliensis (ex Durand et al. 2017)]|uniref:helix-turn-helix transcriptional regulator n=1 Tax=Bittarella massiliensis (ex Durand et al. 2017) TaxID=1720313 RepID=UPI00073E5C52|nr:helix-turn-helix transcriptional regulator [Bittarella massiliensis (ex Durand et al. 2017)]
MDFSSIVKKVRLELSLTQKQLAQALNVSYTTINRWENGHVVPSNLAQKSFFDFCESNFINISQLLKQDGNE